jgi:uncharacterized BrkB/YihY/UPF0761 family membrane protein
MSEFGDILAEHFQLKAKLVRQRYGLIVLFHWLLMTIFVLVARLVMLYWVLKATHAPTWIWWLMWGAFVPGIIVEQLEKK